MKDSLAHRLRNLCLLVALGTVTQLCAAQAGSADCGYLIAGRTFAQQFQGFINFGPVMGVLPNAGGGVLTLHHDGTITGKAILNVGMFGAAQDLTIKAGSAYTLTYDPDKRPAVCAGTAVIDTDLTGPTNFQVVVSDGGDQLELMHTDFSLTVNMTVTPLHRGRCTNRTLDSVYTYSAKGWMLPPPGFPPPPFPSFSQAQLLNGFLPLAFSGAIAYHPDLPSRIEGAPEGSALFEGWDTVSLNGMVVPRKFTGWYKVYPDCTSDEVLVDDIGNPPIHVKGWILEDAKATNGVNLDTGSIMSFRSTRLSKEQD